MKRKKAIFFLFVFLSYIPVLAQVDTGWVRRYNGPANVGDIAYGLAVDDSGNVYVTGISVGMDISLDYATIKYSPTGETLWVKRNIGSDKANTLTLDGSGNVYMTGVSPGIAYNDYSTIKYSPAGDTQWVRIYNGTGNGDDIAKAIAVDQNGYVYVTGASIGSDTSLDYATIMYSPTGETLWEKRYNGPEKSTDEAHALAVDNNWNVYVAGFSVGSGTFSDFATIKYSASGDTQWARRYNGPGDSTDEAHALAVDGNGNVYVTGSSIGIGTSSDYTTIKYSPVGDTLWVRRYNGPANDLDGTKALAMDAGGNVYVTGQSTGSGTGFDFATIKYSPAGDTLWVRRYNGPGDGIDSALALAVDDSGYVYVAGRSWGRGTLYDYATIKYSPAGETMWVRRYNGPRNAWDYANSLAVDNRGNVYVTGRSIGRSAGSDYLTIKYNKFGCAAWAGDANGDNSVDLNDILYELNSIFKAGPNPDPFCQGDANADGNILLTDIVYLINFIFKSGPSPQKSRECCL